MMESNAQGHGAIKKAVISTLAISALGVTTGVSANETEVAVNEPATKVVANNEVVAKVPTQADVDTAKAESDKANQDVAKQKEVVASAEANIATVKKELARLEGIAEVKARGYENFKQLKADHDAYLAEQQRLQALKEKEDAIRKAGGQPQEVKDANGKVVDVVDAKAQNEPVNFATVGTKDDKTYRAPVQASQTKAEPKKQLPNTGTKDSGLLALFGASVGLFALAGKRKYNR